jgi:NTP pyrophosphatase (non-canonical NTP hydrolase)
MLNAKQLYEQVINLKGADNQINQAVEEMAELIQALNKVRRAGVKFTDPTPEREHVLAEMADVQQMLSQLGLIFGVSEKETAEHLYNSYTRLESEVLEWQSQS